MKSRRIFALAVALLCGVSAARADFAFTVGTGATAFSFTASSGGTALCAASVTHCFASVPINTAGAAFFTSGAPGLVTLTGTNNIATVTTVTGVTTVSTVTALTTLTGGGVASGAADSGNPHKIGGKYSASPITLTDGNRGDLQLDVNGYVKTTVTNTNANGQAILANASPVAVSKNSGTGATIAGAAIGTAGTASAEVVTVQGVASMTPVQVSQATAASLNATVVGTGTFATQAASAQSGTWTVQPGNTANTTPWLVNRASPYPSTAVPYTATAVGTTGATTATLAGASSVTTYLCGFSIRANATAAATGNATVTGGTTSPLNFTQWTAPLASGIGIAEMIFSPCLPASAANTSMAVVSAAPGTGGTVSVTAWGYKL